MPESIQSCFELSIRLSVKRTSRELLLKIVRGKKYREMYGKTSDFHTNTVISSLFAHSSKWRREQLQNTGPLWSTHIRTTHNTIERHNRCYYHVNKWPCIL